jgi:threonine dehydrogenase-like Zn-dependent dehydrogenase
MPATIMHGAGDVRIENVPDATLIEPTDALIRVTRACICGSDLWPYRAMESSETGQSMGHEAIGVVEAVGREVSQVKGGDVVIMPFAYSDGSCDFCHEGLQTACVHGGFFGYAGMDRAQAEAVRIPLADGTLYILPGGVDEALMPSLLTLADVMVTGHHAARIALMGPGKSVGVIGDGAVGRVGVPHYPAAPPEKTFYKNVVVGGGPVPVRAYIEELLPDVLDGRIQPGRVFDRSISLDEVPEGYRAMDEREALKVMIGL